MAMAHRQKALLAALALYWPTIFVLTHIPMPDTVRQAHFSDKSLHVLTYMILTFLLFSTVRPSQKAHWRRPAMWWVLLAVAVYALLDEYTQQFVAGRSCDARDLAADAVGMLAGIAVAAFTSFWPGALIVTGTVIYTLAVFTRANLTRILPVASTVLYVANYGVFTFLWIAWTSQISDSRWQGVRRYARMVAGPVALLAAAKISAIASGKQFEGWEIVAGLGGIAGAIAAVSLVRRLLPQRIDAGAAAVEP